MPRLHFLDDLVKLSISFNISKFILSVVYEIVHFNSNCKFDKQRCKGFMSQVILMCVLKAKVLKKFPSTQLLSTLAGKEPRSSDSFHHQGKHPHLLGNDEESPLLLPPLSSRGSQHITFSVVL